MGGSISRGGGDRMGGGTAGGAMGSITCGVVMGSINGGGGG